MFGGEDNFLEFDNDEDDDNEDNMKFGDDDYYIPKMQSVH